MNTPTPHRDASRTPSARRRDLDRRTARCVKNGQPVTRNGRIRPI